MQPSPLPFSEIRVTKFFPGFFQNKTRGVKLFPLGRAILILDIFKGYDRSPSLQSDFFRRSYVVNQIFGFFEESEIYLMVLKVSKF